MSHTILVLCPFEPDAGLISRARQLADTCGGKLHVLCRECDADDAEMCGADFLSAVPDEELPADDGVLAEWLAKKVPAWGADIILAPAGIRMRNIMPMLAWKLDAGLTADCSLIDIDADGRLIQTRPAFGNSLVADIITLGSIQMATVCPHTYRRSAAKPVQTTRIRESITDAVPRVHRLGFERYAVTKPLSQADVILAAGRGIGSKEGFASLTQLAGELGAGIGASRGAVDAGYAPHACQIGLTGISVHPRVYVAVGISGAVQHLAGMSGSEIVIAVNSDRKAPIFSYSDIGIVSDWRDAADSIKKLITQSNHNGGRS